MKTSIVLRRWVLGRWRSRIAWVTNPVSPFQSVGGFSNTCTTVSVSKILQTVYFLPEGDAFPISVGIDKSQRAFLAALRQSAQHAHDRRNPHPAGNEGILLRVGVPVYAEVPEEWPVHIRLLAGLQGLDLPGEVTQLLDGKCQFTLLVGTG